MDPVRLMAIQRKGRKRVYCWANVIPGDTSQSRLIPSMSGIIKGFSLFEIAEQSQGSYLMNDPSHKNVRVSTLWVEQAGSQLECQYAPVGPPDRAPRDVSVQRVFQHSFDNALTQHSSKLSGLETPSMQKYVCFGTIFTQKRFVEIYRLT